MDKQKQIEIAQENWGHFTKATTWVTLATIAVLLLMALFLL